MLELGGRHSEEQERHVAPCASRLGLLSSAASSGPTHHCVPRSVANLSPGWRWFARLAAGKPPVALERRRRRHVNTLSYRTLS